MSLLTKQIHSSTKLTFVLVAFRRFFGFRKKKGKVQANDEKEYRIFYYDTIHNRYCRIIFL